MISIIALMQHRKIIINFNKTKTNFCLSLHYNGDESYLYVNKTETSKFKTWYNFCLESVSNNFTKEKQSGISSNGTPYGSSVNHVSIKKEDIHSIHLYLKVKNNVKM